MGLSENSFKWLAGPLTSQLKMTSPASSLSPHRVLHIQVTATSVLHAFVQTCIFFPNAICSFHI